MGLPCLFEGQMLARAVRAAQRATRRAGASAGEAKVLYCSRRLVLLFPEIATVARVGPADARSLSANCRELSVARHLASKGAPVVAPSEWTPATPFIEEDLAVTLWPNVEHTASGDDDYDAVARAAGALKRVHEGLADYEGELPHYWERIAQCAALLREPEAQRALSVEDRTFLLRAYERLSEALSQFEVGASPIHGDAHLGNAFFTPRGPLWTDFETVCRGPYEWDFAATMHPAAFPGLDRELYAALLELRSLCVAVWCSILAHDTEKRRAAEEQLARLKRSEARGRVLARQRG